MGMNNDKKIKPLEAPEPYSTIIDEVTRQDRLAFEQGAPKEGFDRPYIDGEMWPNEPPPEERHLFIVRVNYVTDGIRARQLLKCRRPIFTEEARRDAIARIMRAVYARN